MVTHAERVRTFLTDGLDAEEIDVICPDLAVPHADYFARNREVIIELKSLQDDRQARVQAVLEKWKPTFGLAYGTVPLDRVLKNHPHGERVYTELVDAALDSVESAYETANRQLRSTRAHFSLPDSHGVVLFSVDDVFFFDPPGLNYALARLFAKKTRDGAVRYPDIDLVFLVTAAHTYALDGDEHVPAMFWIAPHAKRLGDLEELAALLLKKWAGTLGEPLISLSEEQVARMRIVPRKTPTFRID